jgi:hypothetical protein
MLMQGLHIETTSSSTVNLLFPVDSLMVYKQDRIFLLQLQNVCLRTFSLGSGKSKQTIKVKVHEFTYLRQSSALSTV